MSKITIKGFIRANLKIEDWRRADPDVVNGIRYYFSLFGDTGDGETNKTICPHELTFDLPAGWNPTEQQIAALQAEDAELTKQYLTRKNLIAEQISKLQAISYEVQA